MISKEKLGFDPTDADTRAASDVVGARLLTDDGTSPITSGDGDSDNVANTFEGVDARAFGYAYDSSGDNWDRLQINGDGELLVSADLNADFDYVYDEDSAFTEADPGVHNLSVRQDTLATSTSADGDYQSMKSNAKGEVYVIDVDANASLDAIETDVAAIEVELLDQGTTLDSIESEWQAYSHAEDSAHSSGDIGSMPLGVRNDTRSSLSDTDGDYTPFQMTANGDLRVRDDDLISTIDDGVDVNLQDGSGNDIDSYNGCLAVADIADTALKTTAKSATSTQSALLGSSLAARKYLYVQNLGNKHVYIAESGATDAEVTGLRLSPGAVAEFRFGASLIPDIKAKAGSQDVRVLEAS